CPVRGNDLSSNGKQCLNWLSHLSGQAQVLSLILLIQSLTGWVVARTHRAQAVPLITAFAILLIMLAIMLATKDAYLRMLLVDAIDQPRFRPHLARSLATVSAALSVEIVGVYIGGTIGARSRSHVRQR